MVAPHLKANVKAIAIAKRNLSKLNGAQLDTMEAIIGLNPSWAEQPEVLRDNLSDVPVREPAGCPEHFAAAGYLSDCSDTSLFDPTGLVNVPKACSTAIGPPLRSPAPRTRSPRPFPTTSTLCPA